MLRCIILDIGRIIGADAGMAHAYERGVRRGRWVSLTFIQGIRCPYNMVSLIKPPRSHEGLMLDYETILTCEMDVPSSVLADSSTGNEDIFFPSRGFMIE